MDRSLEEELKASPLILEKIKDRRYAQNVYAALCNMRWQRLDVLPILKDEYWSCSWRHAGGIVADMLQKGDYIDWHSHWPKEKKLEFIYDSLKNREEQITKEVNLSSDC